MALERKTGRKSGRSTKIDLARAAQATGVAAVFAFAANGGIADTDIPVSSNASLDTTHRVTVPHAMTPERRPVVIDLEQLPYEQRLFNYNALPPANTNEANLLGAMTPEQLLQYRMKQVCFKPGTVPTVQQQKELSEALDSLAKLTYMGKPLVDLAASGNLRFCGLEHLPAGIAAQYLPGVDAVVSGKLGHREEEVMKLAHEIIHATQSKNGLLSYSHEWDIQSRVARNLSIEAAALTAEFMVAFEAKVAGDPSYWDFIQKQYGGTTYNDKELYRLIETTYQSSIDAGKTQETALRDAGKAAFGRVFESDDWRNFYLNLELSLYLTDLADRKFENATTIAHNQFGPELVAKAGRIGANASFTEGATVPNVDALIARSDKMKWAYEAAEIARYRQMGAHTAPTVSMMRAQALLGGNPYLGLDLVKAYRQSIDESWTKDRKFRYLHEVLDEMLKPPAPLPAPAVPVDPKPDTTTPVPAGPTLAARPVPPRV